MAMEPFFLAKNGNDLCYVFSLYVCFINDEQLTTDLRKKIFKK
jgi:hypothetical protein